MPTRRRLPTSLSSVFIVAASLSVVTATVTAGASAHHDREASSAIANANPTRNALQPPPHQLYQDENEIDGDRFQRQRRREYEEMIRLLDTLGLRNSCVHAIRSDLPDIPLCEASSSVTVSAAQKSRTSTARKLDGKNNGVGEENLEPVEATMIMMDDKHEEEDEKESEWHWSWTDLFLAILCLTVSSIAAGLTVGLVSLDPLVLLIKARAGDTDEASYAQTLLPLVKQRHLLLVTLMLLNTATSEALPVVLHDMMPELFVVIISTLLMLFFGEILPSAVFIGRNQLFIASSLADLVQVVMLLVYPVSYPIAKLLDCLVHDSEGDAVSTNYTRNELAAMIRLQYETKLAERELKRQKQQQQQQRFGGSANAAAAAHGSSSSFRHLDSMTAAHQTAVSAVLLRRNNSLDLDEVMIAEGALALRSRSAQDLVIPIKKVFSIRYEAELTEAMIVHIFASGYSRVPVYRCDDTKQICGILMTRQLILVKASDRKKVSDLPLHSPRCISPHMDLLELVNLFQTGGGCVGRTRRSAGHMTIVCQQPDIANDALQADGDLPIPKAAGLMGIITMEDVLEALLQEQIYDEMDAAGRVSSMPTNNDNDSVSSASTTGSATRTTSRNNRPIPPPARTTAQAAPPPTSSTSTNNKVEEVESTSYQAIV